MPTPETTISSRPILGTSRRATGSPSLNVGRGGAVAGGAVVGGIVVAATTVVAGVGATVVGTVVVGATVVASCSSNFRSRSLWARACSMPVPHSW